MSKKLSFTFNSQKLEVRGSSAQWLKETEGRVLVPRYLHRGVEVYSDVFFATTEALGYSEKALRRHRTPRVWFTEATKKNHKIQNPPGI